MRMASFLPRKQNAKALARRLALPIKLDVSLAATVETKAAKPAGGLSSRLAGAMSSN